MIRRIRANLAFSMTLNLMPIVPTTTAALDPATDALAHNRSSIFMVVNSALPRWKSKKAQLDAAPPACPYFIIQG